MFLKIASMNFLLFTFCPWDFIVFRLSSKPKKAYYMMPILIVLFSDKNLLFQVLEKSYIRKIAL